LMTAALALLGCLAQGVTLPEIPAEVIPEQPHLTMQSISAAEFGLSASAENNFEAMEKAINYCRNHPGITLTLPPGSYRITENKALNFNGLQDVAIEGTGAEFIFYKREGDMFSAHDCERVTFRGFTLDWDWNTDPLFSPMVVTKLAPDKSWVELRYLHRATFPDATFRLGGGFIPLDPTTLTMGCQGMESIGAWRLESFIPVPPNKVRLFFKKSASMQCLNVGQRYNHRQYSYEMHAFVMSRLHDILFENINIYGSAGHGFNLGPDTWNIAFRKCQVTKRPGSDRTGSTSTDIMHIANTQGHILVENCDFGFSGDDCINIHSNSWGHFRRGYTTQDITLEKYEPWRFSLRKGDRIEFRMPDLSPCGFTTTVADIIQDLAINECKVHLSEPIPSGIPEGAILFDLRFDAHNYIFRNCVFHDNHGRGVLSHGRVALIENCHFSKTEGPALQIEAGVEPRWSEGYGANNQTIRNNVFTKCNVGGWLKERGMPAVYIGTYLSNGTPRYPLFHDFLFSENRFINCYGLAYSLSSASSISIQNNLATGMGRRNATFEELVTTQNSPKINMTGNRVRNP